MTTRFHLTHLEWLLQLPKLAFLGFAGNPCSQTQQSAHALPEVDWTDLRVQSLLGEGASGIISSAQWVPVQQDVALKLFKGDVTSDGSPSMSLCKLYKSTGLHFPGDEMNACICAGSHPNLINTIGTIRGHASGKAGLVLQLIPATYTILGQPPSLASCTRDCYPQGLELSMAMITSILTSVASAAFHLHSLGIAHGDLYAHNILINAQGHALLGDLGAATCIGVDHPSKLQLEYVEVLAFGHLMEDLCMRCKKEELVLPQMGNLEQLWLKCVDKIVSDRPQFFDILAELKSQTTSNQVCA